MALSEVKIKEYIKRLLLSRMRILCNHGFFGLLLMHVTYSVSEEVETACTDGRGITFGTKFLDDLSDNELDFVMMHEIMHIVLQHCIRRNDRDAETFNIACDIVVNSNILLENNMDLNSITLKKYGESMHLTPSGKEGHYHTAEEVYEMLPKSGKKKTCDGNSGCAVGRAKQIQANGGSGKAIWDDHSRWGMCEEDDTLRDVWVKRFEDAAESISVRDPSNSRGLLPMFAKRRLEELHKAQTDWRTILNDFIQEEVVDYSFYPPDRRFDGSPFFLPDFNGTDEKVEDILFMIDTSGSMSDKMITAAYFEVKGAIDQFDGKLRGWLGFFDAAIIEPIEFSNEEEFRVIRPAGGGGTDFQIIFEYVATRMTKQPASIIILTDGFCPFPQEKLSLGIPVLWLINNEDVDPPWGKVARIKV
jgi:predicted metal-dependent peptidase